jgi:WD40 repeat protein
VLGDRPFQLDLSSNQPELQAEPFSAQTKSPGAMVLDDSSRLIMSPEEYTGLLIYELRPAPRIVQQRQAFDRRSASLAVKQGEGGIYAGSFDGVVVRHHPVEDKILSEWRLHGGPVLSISLGQSQPVALSAGGDGVVILWDANSGRTLKTWRECPGDVMEVELSPDGHFAAAILNGARVKIWDTRTGETWAEVKDADAKNTLATFSPDSGSILLWSARGLHLWDLDRRIEKVRVGLEEAPVRAGFDSTGGRVWVAYRERAEWRDLALNPIGANVSATENAQGEQELDRLKAKEANDPRLAAPSSFVNVDSASWQKGKRPPKD